MCSPWVCQLVEGSQCSCLLFSWKADIRLTGYMVRPLLLEQKLYLKLLPDVYIGFRVIRVFLVWASWL